MAYPISNLKKDGLWQIHENNLKTIHICTNFDHPTNEAITNKKQIALISMNLVATTPRQGNCMHTNNIYLVYCITYFNDFVTLYNILAQMFGC